MVTTADYRALADLRYHIRCFLNFSEACARKVGIEPQQHQLLLAIRGLGVDQPTIGVIAERLQIQHHSAVELVRRCVAKGLIVKRAGVRDRREVFLEVAPKGRRILERLAVSHRLELRSMAPALLTAIGELT